MCGVECVVCKGEKGGNCRKRSVTYKIICGECSEEDKKAVYFGETNRCGYQQSLELDQKYNS